MGRYIGRHATKYEPRLRIERCYTGVGHHQNHRPRDYKISDDFKKPIEYLKEIADAHAANVQSMDKDEKYIADTGLEGAYGVHVRRKTRRGRLSVGYEFVLWELPEDEMKQVVDLLNSFQGRVTLPAVTHGLLSVFFLFTDNKSGGRNER